MGQSVGKMDDETRETLRRSLFEISLAGITSAGEAFPLGAFMIVGAMVDMLAGLRYAPSNDFDGKQGRRYARFVHEYFPERYGAMKLGPVMWRSLRCTALHNFSSRELGLAVGQPSEHLSIIRGRVILNWPSTLEDYTAALHAYWDAMSKTPELEANASRRCLDYPPLTVRYFERGVSFPVSFPLSFGGGASAYGSGP